MAPVPGSGGVRDLDSRDPPGQDPPLRVLILEDNEADAGLLRASLGATPEISVELEWIDRLGPGLERLAEGGIDVTIIDLSLPDSSGLDTFRAVRDQAPEIPLLILTGQEDENLGVTAISEGAQDYLVKGERWPRTLARSLRYAIARQKMLADLRRLVVVDELTGLHNRREFVRLAGQLLKLADRKNLTSSLLYMDIDGMKAINDTHGHHRGDDVFVAVAARLRRLFRASDVVARVGGDEFCALLVADGSHGNVPVRRLLEEPITIVSDNGPALAVSLSVGVARRDPDDHVTIEELMLQADAAMYRDKVLRRRGGGMRA